MSLSQVHAAETPAEKTLALSTGWMLPTQGPSAPVTIRAFSSTVSWSTKACARWKASSQPPLPVAIQLVGPRVTSSNVSILTAVRSSKAGLTCYLGDKQGGRQRVVLGKGHFDK
ncbi:hypothetical protein KC329_g66 [Hortaea werneckii]|nr:hypothetical protein KC329_g66 [Hortaea werneckii]